MSLTQEYIRIIEESAPLSEEEIIMIEIKDWKASNKRKWMEIGDRYYRFESDILSRERRVVGENGVLTTDGTLTNRKLVHGFLRKLVDQKAGYMLSKKPSLQTKNTKYAQALSEYFDENFLLSLKNTGKSSIKRGLEWMQVYYNDKGKLSFRKMQAPQIIPLWTDDDHTELNAIIRIYPVEYYVAKNKRLIEKVEFWNKDGVNRYILDPSGPSGLLPDPDYENPGSHFMVGGKPFNWEEIPFVCFKYNEDEVPLIQFIKSLIDDYDEQRSDNSNNIADLPNGIYVLKDFDGQDLGEFRRNLIRYRAVKVAGEGGVDTLTLDLNPEALDKHVEQLRKDIYEFGRGIDTQSEKFGNSPSGVALKFLYGDVDLDANDMEAEYQAAIKKLLWFVNQDLKNRGVGDFSAEKVDFIFNRDVAVNESEAVTDAKNSVGVISQKTIVSNHPWVTDADAELKQMKAEEEEATARMPTYPGLEDTDPDTDGDEQ